MSDRPMDVISTDDARAKVPNIKVIGNPDTWRLICKASGPDWYRSTKAMEVPGGVVLQVSSDKTDALTFVPGVRIAEDVNGGAKLI